MAGGRVAVHARRGRGLAQEDALAHVDHPAERDQALHEHERDHDPGDRHASELHGARQDHQLAPEAGEGRDPGDRQDAHEERRGGETAWPVPSPPRAEMRRVPVT